MNNILIFYGSNKDFMKHIPNTGRNLTDIVMELDNDSKKSVMIVKTADQEIEEEPEKKLVVKDFIINSDEYCGVREHVITNFPNFIAKMEITNMYIQNPPLHISEQLHRLYDEKNIIEEKVQPYKKINQKLLKQINSEYDNIIIGQEKAKTKILQALYPQLDNKRKKPVVLLLYGDSGVGKTETAQYLAKLLHGKLMRKQFSMYQNNQFATYLFGGGHSEASFAKDLLDRDSDVILLDEFDKANSMFHSAFYQLFDEGIYEDQNYQVKLEKSIIICTSNYKSIDEIKEKLGNAIYNRFDSVIHFEDLSIEAKTKIADKIMEETIKNFKKKDVILDEDLQKRLRDNAIQCSNVREIQRLIESTFSLVAIRKMCS
ncbi:MAG: AAA family ATPase [Suipraeoptans sp.]